MIFLGVGAPHSWRNVYMDGRPHPKDLKPSWYGHSIGKWEGDTLVVDTVGFNERFWLTREGVPHTSQLHLIEKFSRPNHDQLKYEATVDDPGAYTQPGPVDGTCAGRRAMSPSTISARKTTGIRDA